MKYYVVQTIFTMGGFEVEIINHEQAEKLGYYNGMAQHHGDYTIFVDGFMTQLEAEEWEREVKNI